MRYLTLQFGVLTLICTVMVGCATLPPIIREIIVFDYTPTKEATPGSANVTFAVVGTQIGTNFGGNASPLFRDFAGSMTNDFMEVLTAQGFGVRGPFSTYDEILFPDKQASDLILTAKFEINPDLGNVPLEVTYYSSERYRPSAGTLYLDMPVGAAKPNQVVIIKGNINLTISESLTNEKVWTKSVPITPFRVPLPFRRGTSWDAEATVKWSPDNVESLLIESGAVSLDWILPAVDIKVDSFPDYDDPEYDQKVSRRKDQISRLNKQATQRLRAVKRTNFICLLLEIDAFHNAIGPLLQSQYYEIMNKTYGYLNPEEMKIVKNQSQELRKRKVY